MYIIWCLIIPPLFLWFAISDSLTVILPLAKKCINFQFFPITIQCIHAFFVLVGHYPLHQLRPAWIKFIATKQISIPSSYGIIHGQQPVRSAGLHRLRRFWWQWWPWSSLSGNLLCLEGYDDFLLMSIVRGENDYSIKVEDMSTLISECHSNRQVVPSEIALQNKHNKTTDPPNTIENVLKVFDNFLVPKWKLIAHNNYNQDQGLLCIFDIATDREFWGIMQNSAQTFFVTVMDSKNQSTSLGPIFNKYIE